MVNYLYISSVRPRQSSDWGPGTEKALNGHMSNGGTAGVVSKLQGRR